MSGIAEWKTKITLDIEDLQKRLRQAEDSLDSVLNKEHKVKIDIDTKTLDSAIKKLDSMLDSLGKGTDDFKQFETLSKDLSKVASELGDFTKAFGKIDDSGTKSLLSSIQNIDKSLSDLSKHILNVNKNMNSIGGNSNNTVKQIENITKANKEAIKSTENLAKSQEKLGNITNVTSSISEKDAIKQAFNVYKKEAAEFTGEINKNKESVAQLLNELSKLNKISRLSSGKVQNLDFYKKNVGNIDLNKTFLNNTLTKLPKSGIALKDYMNRTLNGNPNQGDTKDLLKLMSYYEGESYDDTSVNAFSNLNSKVSKEKAFEISKYTNEYIKQWKDAEKQLSSIKDEIASTINQLISELDMQEMGSIDAKDLLFFGRSVFLDKGIGSSIKLNDIIKDPIASLSKSEYANNSYALTNFDLLGKQDFSSIDELKDKIKSLKSEQEKMIDSVSSENAINQIQKEINAYQHLLNIVEKIFSAQETAISDNSSNSIVQSQEKTQLELKETQEQAEKTERAIKEASSTVSQNQMKDAFPDKDVSASVESATNSIKEENNVLEQNTQKVKENTQAKEQNVNVNFNKYDKRLDSYNGKIDKYKTTIDRFNDGGWTSNVYLENVQAVENAVKEYEDLLKELKGKDASLVTSEDINKLDNYEKKIKDTIATVTNMSAAEKGYNFVSGQKELDKIHKLLAENSKMSSEAKAKIRAYYAEIESGNPSMSLDRIHGEIMKIYNAEVEAGRAGRTLWDTLKNSRFHQIAAQMAGMVGVYDVINLGKEGFNVVRELNTALTEMRKVSDETVQNLKDYQVTSFDTADAVGTTAKQIQNSTADWMRLGESMNQAAESAKDANVLLNVSEFEGIDEATESLVSMSQAYKDLDKMDIIDVLNNIGNNYSISTDGLATALKDSASALVTANNNLNEAVSLTTAGNAITQDPSKVGAGLRTISLRLVGTEEAKQELSDLGEETDGMITTVSKLRDTIMDATKAASSDGKGFDILDSNGNYKSTYEIMQGLADLYDNIVKKDKELGTNNLNLLLETIAGKNRSNIAASILQNGDMLRSVYEDAQNSEGSAEKELNSYLDSIDGRQICHVA